MGALEIVAFVFSALAFGFSVWNMIELQAMKRTTHNFYMYDPNKQKFENTGNVMEKSDDKKMDEIYDNII